MIWLWVIRFSLEKKHESTAIFMLPICRDYQSYWFEYFLNRSDSKSIPKKIRQAPSIILMDSLQHSFFFKISVFRYFTFGTLLETNTVLSLLSTYTNSFACNRSLRIFLISKTFKLFFRSTLWIPAYFTQYGFLVKVYQKILEFTG